MHAEKDDIRNVNVKKDEPLNKAAQNEVVQNKGNSKNILQRAKLESHKLSYSDVMQLQKIMGNQAVCQLFANSIVQSKDVPKEEAKEALQGKFGTVLQVTGNAAPVYAKLDISTKIGGVPVNDDPALEHEADVMGSKALQLVAEPIREKDGEARLNHSELPDNLKEGVERLSGISLDDVRVHYNSEKPMQLNALAYAQGRDIHVGVGQEKHLPHEAWHLVQQREGRVAQTRQMKQEPANCTYPVQRVHIIETKEGINSEVNTAQEIADLFGMTKEKVIEKIGEHIVYLPYDEKTLNRILKEKSFDYIEGEGKNEVLSNIAKLYREHFNNMRDNFDKTIGAIADDNSNKINRDYHALKAIYGQTGGEDGMSVKDEWNSNLACSLFALLLLRPNFLGARTPEELHGIFRNLDNTKEYDDTELIGKIRLAAGLKFSTTYSGKKVNTFIESLKTSDQGRKIIVDLVGVAHTFTIIYDGGQWKRFDNDAPTGSANINYGNVLISCTWE